MTENHSEYRLEVLFWTRTYDGDDWTTGEHFFHYKTLEEAVAKAEKPFSDNEGLISSEIYSIVDGKKELVFSKDWEK